MVVLAIAAVAVPMYQGFRPRAIVTHAIDEAMPLRARIDEFHANNRRLPDGAAAATYRLDRELNYTKSVVWSPAERMLIVTMGENMHRGKRFGWKAEPRGASIEWKCSGIDLEAKYLPANCR